MTVKFNQRYTDVTKVTVHFQYAKFKNQMLQCYSVQPIHGPKVRKNMLIIPSYFVVL